jgi:hypothetical protein
MNQQTLARMLRIQCVEKVCDIDLPWFLIDTIESSLAMINAYKLTNLIENIDTVHVQLTALWEQYSLEVAKLTTHQESANRHRNILQYLTNTLLHKTQSTKLILSKTEAIRLNNVYTITCLMMLKEHIHRNTTIKIPQPARHLIRATVNPLAITE